MRGLREALKSVLPDPTSLGGDGRNIDRAKLSGVLQDLASSLTRALALRVVLAGAIVVVLALIAWHFSNEVGALVGATASIVIVVAGAGAALRAVTDELA